MRRAAAVPEQDEYISLIVDSLNFTSRNDRSPSDRRRSTGSLDRTDVESQEVEVLNGIDAELKRRDTWQGKLWGILMGFLSVLSFAHKLVSERLRPGDIALDATAGTGPIRCI